MCSRRRNGTEHGVTGALLSSLAAVSESVLPGYSKGWFSFTEEKTCCFESPVVPIRLRGRMWMAVVLSTRISHVDRVRESASQLQFSSTRDHSLIGRGRSSMKLELLYRT